MPLPPSAFTRHPTTHTPHAHNKPELRLRSELRLAVDMSRGGSAVSALLRRGRKKSVTRPVELRDVWSSVVVDAAVVAGCAAEDAGVDGTTRACWG
mgnify:CR=1 FL=1